MEKNEKSGVFTRVKNRWRSIFSKKNPIKLRESNQNHVSLARCIMSDPDENFLGTIMAETVVEPVELPNGGGFTLRQETKKFQNLNYIDEISLCDQIRRPRRFNRVTSGEINFVRRMTEEIDLSSMNVVINGNEISGETDEKSGAERACFKPGPHNPTDEQMTFLKQCLDQIDTRPQNMNYLTKGWTLCDFETFLKTMLKNDEDILRRTFLRVEFKDIPFSLKYLNEFVKTYATFKDYKVDPDYVYATIHSKKDSRERKLRGHLHPFLIIEDKVRQAKISYLTKLVITCPKTPNIFVAVRFYCLKSCRTNGPNETGIILQLDQITGSRYEPTPSVVVRDAGCIECNADLANIRVVYDDKNKVEESDDEDGENEEDQGIEETDFAERMSPVDGNSKEYLEMFPLLFSLIDIAEKNQISENSNSGVAPNFDQLDSDVFTDGDDDEDEDDDSSDSDSDSDSDCDESDTESSSSEDDDDY